MDNIANGYRRAPESPISAPSAMHKDSALSRAVDFATSRVVDDDALRTEVNEYLVGGIKTAALFTPGKAGLVGMVATNALDQIDIKDDARTQIIDGTLGAVKGLTMKGVFSATDRLGGGIALKAVMLGTSSRLTDSVFERRNYLDDHSRFNAALGCRRTIDASFDRHALVADVVTFGLAHGLTTSASTLLRAELAKSIPLTNAITGSAFGFSTGAYGEISRQRELGIFDPREIGRKAAIQSAVDGVAAVPGGIHRARLLRKAGHGAETPVASNSAESGIAIVNAPGETPLPIVVFAPARDRTTRRIDATPVSAEVTKANPTDGKPARTPEEIARDMAIGKSVVKCRLWFERAEKTGDVVTVEKGRFLQHFEKVTEPEGRYIDAPEGRLHAKQGMWIGTRKNLDGTEMRDDQGNVVRYPMREPAVVSGFDVTPEQLASGKFDAPSKINSKEDENRPRRKLVRMEEPFIDTRYGRQYGTPGRDWVAESVTDGNASYSVIGNFELVRGIQVPFDQKSADVFRRLEGQRASPKFLATAAEQAEYWRAQEALYGGTFDFKKVNGDYTVTKIDPERYPNGVYYSYTDRRIMLAKDIQLESGGIIPANSELLPGTKLIPGENGWVMELTRGRKIKILSPVEFAIGTDGKPMDGQFFEAPKPDAPAAGKKEEKVILSRPLLTDNGYIIDTYALGATAITSDPSKNPNAKYEWVNENEVRLIGERQETRQMIPITPSNPISLIQSDGTKMTADRGFLCNSRHGMFVINLSAMDVFHGQNELAKTAEASLKEEREDAIRREKSAEAKKVHFVAEKPIDPGTPAQTFLSVEPRVGRPINLMEYNVNVMGVDASKRHIDFSVPGDVEFEEPFHPGKTYVAKAEHVKDNYVVGADNKYYRTTPLRAQELPTALSYRGYDGKPGDYLVTPLKSDGSVNERAKQYIVEKQQFMRLFQRYEVALQYIQGGKVPRSLAEVEAGLDTAK